MKKVLSVLLALYSVNVFAAAVCTDHDSNRNCTQGTLNGLTYKGNIIFDKTTVNGLAKLQGNSDIQNANFDKLNLNGNGSLVSSNVNTFKVRGSVYAKDVTVKGDTNVLGKFYGANTIIANNAKLVGVIDCDHCSFQKNTMLYGDVVMSDSEVLGSLSLNSAKNEFYQSKLNDIVVKKSVHHEKQVISLNHGTIAKNIRFEGQGGVVMLDSSSSILGKVENGTIVKVKG